MAKECEIEELFTPIALQNNIELVDVCYVKEDNAWILRVFIDKDKGITMNDCAQMSYIFSSCLDESDILKDPYTLEVSSPGLNRALKKEENFKRFIGSKVRIKTFNAINNQRNFLGILLDFKDRIVKISDVTNGIVNINFSDISKANIETDI